LEYLPPDATSVGRTYYEQSNEFTAIADSSTPTGLTQESPPDVALLSDSCLGLEDLKQLISRELQTEIKVTSPHIDRLAFRIAVEVERICYKSGRIQTSGEMHSWQLTLARHRLQKCLNYYHLGSPRGRVELHSTLGSMVYRHIAPARLQLGFQARYNLIEDFLQGFYSESLKAFRRENELMETYQPRTRLELAEYMAFTEHYAKRRINLPGGNNQQLIVLRAQRFSRRQPAEVSVDIEQALESPKGEEAELHNRSPITQQLRDKLVAEAIDGSSDAVLRDRVISELILYLKSQDQGDCVNYLTLKLQDLPAPEIDQILGLTPRQRDYLQQRFKYHVEKFSLSQNWKLVHQWLGADLDQNLGLSTEQWQSFINQLSPDQHELLQLKQSRVSDDQISKELKCTSKQLQKRWGKLLDVARRARNQAF
jgi:hypothetical protein